MKQLQLFLALFLSLNLCAQDAWNVELFGQFNRGDERYSGSWAYIAPDGSEYALLGAKTGLAVYSIDDAAAINELGFVPGPATNWREITVVGQHAYVTTDVQDDGHSMQVVDLSFLPDSVHLVTEYTATFQKGHIIQSDIYNDEPYVYVMGTQTTEGVHIMDISAPENPVEVGAYVPGYYIHDAHVKDDFLYACAFYEDQIDIVDISDKSNPTLVTTIPDPGDNTHSAWLTEDNNYLLVADERDNFPMHIFDLQDLDNITEVATYTANEASLVHNPYIRGDFAFLSHNTEGLRVVDIADPTLPVEVGYYDTWAGASGGFSGLWSACPFFPSGKIIGGDRVEGLFVWTFNDTRAARFYGVVKNAVTGEILPDATVYFTQNDEFITLDNDAAFKRGLLAGDYTLEVSLPNFISQTVELNLLEGDQTQVEILLEPIPDFTENPAGQDLQFEAFPNPTAGVFSIDFKDKIKAGDIVVYNNLGQTLFTQALENQTTTTIQLTDFPSGIYFAALQINGVQQGVAKVVKK